MPVKNEAIVCQLIEEVLNGGQTDLLAELVAADHVGHDPLGDHYGREGLRIVVAEYRAAFPDLQLIVEDLVAEGDKVVTRIRVTGTHEADLPGDHEDRKQAGDDGDGDAQSRRRQARREVVEQGRTWLPSATWRHPYG